MKRWTFLLLSLCLGATYLNGQETPVPKPQKGQYPLMYETDLSTFNRLVEIANLVDFFQGTGPFTAFVPSNEAFAKFDQKNLEKLKQPESRDQLIDLINYHVILGKYLSNTIKPGTFRTVNGKNITIKKDDDGTIWVNDAKVVRIDLCGPNGVAHVIDTVLVP